MINLFKENLRTNNLNNMDFEHFSNSTKKICDILIFMAKNRVKRGHFSKVSTGEFRFFSGRLIIWTGPVRSGSGPAGPVPVYRTGSSSVPGYSIALHLLKMINYYQCMKTSLRDDPQHLKSYCSATDSALFGVLVSTCIHLQMTIMLMNRTNGIDLRLSLRVNCCCPVDWLLQMLGCSAYTRIDVSNSDTAWIFWKKYCS